MNKMGLHITTFAIDKILNSIPTNQRYDWDTIREQVGAAGFNCGSWLWWLARHPQIGEDE